MPDTQDAPVDPNRANLAELIQHIHTYSFTTKSDLARDNADLIAEAATLGYISTRIVPGQDSCGRRWKVTVAGLHFLASMSSVIGPQEIAAYQAKHPEDLPEGPL